MDMLPVENQPVVGTLGAKHRKKQIERQLPTHDMDMDACHALSEMEKQNMEDFVKMYKKHAVGAGKVVEQEEGLKLVSVDSFLTFILVHLIKMTDLLALKL